MKILILNGNPNKGNKDFDRYIESLCKELTVRGRESRIMLLRNMNINHCTGCWSCWWKTPGVCIQHDDMPTIYRAMIAADLLLYASPVIMGFISALLTRTKERSIPLIHPFFEMREGEWHHKVRYEQSHSMGIILGKDKDTDDEDIRIITDIFRRTAINANATFRHAFTTDRPVKEACDAISAL